MQELDLKDAAIIGALGNSRTLYQYTHMHNYLSSGKCPFCHLEELKYKPIIKKGNWIVKHNDMPYNNCEYHLVIIYTGGHATDWKKLSRNDYACFMEIINDAEAMFNIEGCAVVFRRGAIRRHIGTLTHLHGHIMVVKLDDEGMPVGELRAYFAKSREELAYCKKMLDLFERARTGNMTGVKKGFVVFDSNGKYITRNNDWSACNTPNEAELLEIPLEKLRERYSEKEGLHYYEVLNSVETGTLLVDGPFKL